MLFWEINMPSLYAVFSSVLSTVLSTMGLASAATRDVPPEVKPVAPEVKPDQYVGLENVGRLFRKPNKPHKVLDYKGLESVQGLYDRDYEYVGISSVNDLLTTEEEKPNAGVDSVFELFNPDIKELRKNRKEGNHLSDDKALSGLSKFLNSKEGFHYSVDYLNTIRKTLNDLDTNMSKHLKALKADQMGGSLTKMVQAIRTGEKFKDKIHHLVRDELLNVGLIDEDTQDIKAALDMEFSVPGMDKKVKLGDLPRSLNQEITDMKKERGYATNKDKQKLVADLEAFSKLAQGWIDNIRDPRTTNMKIVDLTIEFFSKARKLASDAKGLTLAMMTTVGALGYMAYQKVSGLLTALKDVSIGGFHKSIELVQLAMESIGGFVKSVINASAYVMGMAALNLGYYKKSHDYKIDLSGTEMQRVKDVFEEAALCSHIYDDEIDEHKLSTQLEALPLDKKEGFKSEVHRQHRANKDYDGLKRDTTVKADDYKVIIDDLRLHLDKVEETMIKHGRKMNSSLYTHFDTLRSELTNDIHRYHDKLHAVLPSVGEKASKMMSDAGESMAKGVKDAGQRLHKGLFGDKQDKNQSPVTGEDLKKGPESKA